jgi:hypothetical protein
MDIQLTETKVFDIEQPPCNPVAIYWLKNGAWNYWVFGCRQINSIDVSDGAVLNHSFRPANIQPKEVLLYLRAYSLR